VAKLGDHHDGLIVRVDDGSQGSDRANAARTTHLVLGFDER
jgi:hypothetical protein